MVAVTVLRVQSVVVGVSNVKSIRKDACSFQFMLEFGALEHVPSSFTPVGPQATRFSLAFQFLMTRNNLPVT